VLVVAVSIYAKVSYLSEEAQIRAIATAEVAERTTIPKSSWAVRSCTHEGDEWQVTLEAEPAGTAVVTISSAA